MSFAEAFCKGLLILYSLWCIWVMRKLKRPITKRPAVYTPVHRIERKAWED